MLYFNKLNFQFLGEFMKFSTLSTLIKNITLYLILPLIIIMRSLSWNKIYANKIYFAYKEIQNCMVELDVSSLPTVGRILFFILESIPAICFMIAIWYFLKLLECYRRKIFFSLEVIQLLKKISIIALIWAMYALFFETLVSLLISAFKPAGQRCIAICIGHENVTYFFLVFILFMILHLIQEAYKLKTEQDLVV